MAQLNPYSSPSNPVDEDHALPFPPHTRSITCGAIVVSIFALLATYGYPSRMTPFWHFYLLPSLALLAIALTTFGLGRRHGNSFSVVPVIVTLAIISIFAVATSILACQSGIHLMDVTPRIFAAAIGWAAAVAVTMQLHRPTDRRRGLVFANGLAILQATTSIADTISLGLGPW